MRTIRLTLLACTLLAGSLLWAGCAMKRTVTIDSNPTGAAVWVNGARQPSATPVTVPFSQYGRFDVRLEKPGYQSVATEVHIASQIDGYPFVDLPFEVLGGSRHFTRVIPMQPLPNVSSQAEFDAILGDARTLRDRARIEVGEPGTPGRQAPEFLR
ncbi:MAG: PEGA domain-containing protein [Planctomycetota bacterium]|nr:PEGA domain-containing protein [Planctomycetota bacterium]